MAKDKFYEILKQLNNQEYKGNSITIASYEDDEESLKDNIGDEEIILLCEALKKNPHVIEITFYLQNIGDQGVIALAEIDILEKVTIYCGRFGIAGACALAQANIKYLSLAGGYITEDKHLNTRKIKDIQPFIQALIQNNSLEIIDLSSAYIPSSLLAQLIENTTSIKTIYLSQYFDEKLLIDIHINQEQITLYTYNHKEIILLGDQITEE